MNAVEPATTITKSNAKSCIQAFLKTREEHQIRSRSSRKYSQKNIDHYSGGFAIESQAFSKNLPINADHYTEFTYQASTPENIDNQNDFNYSQKLFHIADGNLYSVFSPIQGRSYGMKPSFLRKQKYTVQECHSRGRKNLRKGLKFHNFLPSESVTSEKDNGYLRTKWKVHSECRLREEHGTKQITISNWSQSVQNSSEDPLLQNSFSKPRPTSMKVDGLLKEHVQNNEESRIENGQMACDNDPYDFNLSLRNSVLEKVPLQNSNESSITESKVHDLSKSVSLKKNSLRFVLNSLLDKPTVAESHIGDVNPRSCQSYKHRRKPIQTRRVVPYKKYLSIIEEDESSPLDLSSKCLGDKYLSALSFEEDSLLSRQSKLSCDDVSPLTTSHSVTKSDNFNVESVSNSKLNLIACNKIGDNFVDSPIDHIFQNQMSSPLVLLSTPMSNTLNVKPKFSETSKMLHETGVLNGKPNFNLNINQIKIKNSYPPLHTNPGPSFSSNVQYAVHKSFVKNCQPKTRRRSQRSVIKKNLEDTFRQNGFLVKTKQVSDGEATFCKFRQLRKYTRYYLKSWQQHLPDEVHKMWKGFLPPKTVLPPVSGTTESTNGMH